MNAQEIATFIADNNLDETAAKNLAAFCDEYAHRVENFRVDGDWVVADTTKSERTMAKHANRFKDTVRASFCRSGRAGFRI